MSANATSSESNTQSTALDVTASFIATRTLLVSIVMCLGIVGNGFVLWFYGKNKKLTGQVYILALAVIDLYSCVILLPQITLMELGLNRKLLIVFYTLGYQSILQLVPYLGVQVTMALDQFIAVSWPFQHARLRRKLNRAMLGICAAVILILVSLRTVVFFLSTVGSLFLILYLTVCVVSVLVLMIAYPATAYKLYRQSTAVQPQLQVRLRDLMTKGRGTAQPSAQSDVKKSQLHEQALKIYTAILLQSMMSTLLSMVGYVLFDLHWMLYFFWINHIGNPVIYYLLVPKFRAGVKESVRVLYCRTVALRK